MQIDSHECTQTQPGGDAFQFIICLIPQGGVMRIGNFIQQAKRALRSKKGRQFLDKAENAARNATGGKHDDKIRKARRATDRAIGDDDDEGPNGAQSSRPRR
ncbi:antitoxin [Brevibacterium sp. S22]|uniref:antitoxin n=2 Tax=Brevibacterium TaxID=1696 RepID=UPI003211EFFF